MQGWRHESARHSLAAKVYPNWVREIVLEMYRQGFNHRRITGLTGVPTTTSWRWCNSEGISRSISKALQKGDDVGYVAQHDRGVKDHPNPLGTCQFPDCENNAVERARIDHTNFPYRKEYVMPMCKSHNQKHNLYNDGRKIADGFVILFREVP